jgi:hypothetical protein
MICATFHVASTLAHFMDISTTVKKFEEAKEVIITWFSVLTRDPNAFDRIDLEKSSTLFYALRFMLYMSFVDFLLHIPTVAKFGLKSVIIEPVWILETYLEYLLTAFIVYVAMRLFGGKGTLQACIAAYCLLTAYLPIIGVLMLPIQKLVVPNMTGDAQVPEVIRAAFDSLNRLPAWESVGIFLSFALSTTMFVLFFVSVFRTFRMLHRLNKARALLAFLLGLATTVVVLVFFLEPLLSSVLPKRAS